MIAYPDTSFLCALYRLQMNSVSAAEHFSKMPEPLHVSSPLFLSSGNPFGGKRTFTQRIRQKASQNTLRTSHFTTYRPTSQRALSSWCPWTGLTW